MKPERGFHTESSFCVVGGFPAAFESSVHDTKLRSKIKLLEGSRTATNTHI